MSIGNIQAIRDWINSNYYSKDEIIDLFYTTYSCNIFGGANETITMTEDAPTNRTWTFVTSNTGSLQSLTSIKLLPGSTITLRGSISGQTFTQKIGLETTINLLCMPVGSVFWYGNSCSSMNRIGNSTTNWTAFQTASNNYNMFALSTVMKIGFGYTSQSINADKTNISQYSGTTKIKRSLMTNINDFAQYTIKYTLHRNKTNELKLQVVLDENNYIYNIYNSATTNIADGATTTVSVVLSNSSATPNVVNRLGSNRPYPAAYPQINVISNLENCETANETVENYFDIHEFYFS